MDDVKRWLVEKENRGEGDGSEGTLKVNQSHPP